ncbi:hypothetical protein OCAE111667_05210 [Occultella aeris]|uniref:Uncharacterized protein n=1 Tax=Occultella aeris TaxID=2761496 RepID=A0A7M4DM71_9MICO|nr:hypothetical protein HALOF300_03239 [Occultella aeris]
MRYLNWFVDAIIPSAERSEHVDRLPLFFKQF